MHSGGGTAEESRSGTHYSLCNPLNNTMRGSFACCNMVSMTLPMRTAVAYYRVSTAKQGQSGLGSKPRKQR